MDLRRLSHKKSPPEDLWRADASPGWLLQMKPHPLVASTLPGGRLVRASALVLMQGFILSSSVI